MSTNGKYLLDTNIVIAMFDGETSVIQRFESADIAVPAIVLGELFYGARLSNCPTENDVRIREFAGYVSILPCDEITAVIYAEIKHELRIKGRPIPENDLWIGALAVQHQLVLATRDTHFRNISRLVVAAW